MRTFSVTVIVALALCAAAFPVRADIMASATVSDSQINPTTFQYDLTLNNLGTTTIGTFWFGWVPGEDFMPTSPFNISTPAGWSDTVTNGGAADGFAIQFVTTADLLAPGKSLAGFSFDSTTTPAQMAGLSPFYPTTPVETSFVYIATPLADPGFQFVASNAVQAVPEPSTLGLAGVGLGLLFLVSWRRKRYARS